MSISNTLGHLGHYLDEWDREEATIRSVTISDEARPISDGSISAEVTLDIPVVTADEDRDGIVACTPSMTREGAIGLTLETTLSVTNTGPYRVDAEPVDATLHADGTATVTVSLTLSGIREEYTDDHSAASEYGETAQIPDPAVERDEKSSEDEPEGGDGGVPPFRDPELLQEIYDTHDTFAEMAKALDMDVTGETVRRYMIDYDIHKPNSYRTESSSESAGSNDRTETILRADGLGLPDTVSVEALIETVNQSNTIYEVKEDLDLERAEAHELLKRLNLVDLVMGRLANDKNREIGREDVIERLKEASQARAQ